MMKKKAFLLFEVMVSILIFTSSILFIARSYSSSKDTIRRSTDMLKTSLLLENHMWQYEATGEIDPNPAAWEGNFPEDPLYAWFMASIPEQDQKYNLVVLNVYQRANAPDTGYSISTYLKQAEKK